MKPITIFYTLCAATMSAVLGFGNPAPKKVHVGELRGFEKPIQRALTADGALTLVENAGEADYQVVMEERRSGSTALLYLKNTGRRDSRILRLQDRKTGKAVVELPFDGYSQAVAERFAGSVRQTLLP